MRTIWTPISIFFIFFATGYFLFLAGIGNLVDGFDVGKISSDLECSPSREVVSPPHSQIRKILSQNFYYLGKGSQCYVFESEDGQYVLKFFRYPRYRFPWFAKHLSLPPFLSAIQNEHLKTKKKKLNALLKSCKLAYLELREESGLIFIHLNKSTYLDQRIFLYDSLKRVNSVNIDNYEFLIQKKTELLYPYLARLIREGKETEAKEALSDLVTIIIHRFQKGIADNDAVIHKNSGFRNGKAQYLDVGQFIKDPKMKNRSVYQVEAKKITKTLRLWLEENDPKLAQFFEEIL